MMHPAVTGGDISDLRQLFIGCFIFIQTSAIALFSMLCVTLLYHLSVLYMFEVHGLTCTVS